jgi:diguanylate cyclase (GGDEF)-like protein
MSAQENVLESILELGSPTERRTRGELHARALRMALQLTDADGATLVLTSSGRRGERLLLHSGSTAPAKLPPAGEASEVLAGLARSCQPLALPDLTEDPHVAAGDACPGVDAGPVLFTPLRRRDPAPAYLAVYRRRGRARFTAGDSRALLLLGAWLSAALENLRLASGTEKLTVKDELTEVYNQRFLESALRREIQRAGRHAQDLSVILVEIDDFEALVAEHGDLKASLLLKELAALLAHEVRSFDVLGRYESGAFLLVLPQTAGEGALEAAERVRAAVEQHTFSLAPAGAVTVSLGVASFPQAGVDASALTAGAERALKEARRTGRNHAVILGRKAA